MIILDQETAQDCENTIYHLLHIVKQYDERLAKIDGPEKVYTTTHKAGLEKAKNVLDKLRNHINGDGPTGPQIGFGRRKMPL